MTFKVKTIATDEPTYEAFRQMAKAAKLTNPELLATMMEYFRVTKADPQQPTGPDITASLAKLTAKLADLDKRTIGFIREQEKTYLKPILADVRGIHERATGPGELSEAQLAILEQWLTAVIRTAFKPEYRHPDMLGVASPHYTVPPELAPLRKVITRVFNRELNPAQIIPQAPKPTPPTTTPPPSLPSNPPA